MTLRRRGLIAVLAVAGVFGLLPAATASATFPGGNGRIVFVRAGDLHTVTPAGTGLRRLTAAGGASLPTWSPDGTRLVFERRGYVWTSRADGTGQVRVARGAAPSWSPDGRQLAFVRHDDAACEDQVATVRSTAPFGAPRRLAGYYECEGSDARIGTTLWSQDGRTVIYNVSGQDSGGSLSLVFEVDVATAQQQEARFGYGFSYGLDAPCPGGHSDLQPAIGPAGAGLVFVGNYPRMPGYDCQVRLYTSLRDGSELRQIGAVTGVSRPKKAPDGSAAVLFAQRSAGGSVLRIIHDTPGGTVRTVITDASQPDWQPLPRS